MDTPSPASVSGGLTAVDVQRLPRDERGLLEIQDPLDDIGYLTHTPQGMKATQLRIRRAVVPGRLDDTERDRVDAYSAGGVLDGQRPGHGNEPALGQGG